MRHNATEPFDVGKLRFECHHKFIYRTREPLRQYVKVAAKAAINLAINHTR